MEVHFSDWKTSRYEQARDCEHLQNNSFSSNDMINGKHDKNDHNRGKFNHSFNFGHTKGNGN